MGFFFLLLYLVLSYLRVQELYPWLVSYRIMLWMGIAGIAATLFSLLVGRRPTFRAIQIYLMLGLMSTVALSVIAHGWFGGGLRAFQDFGITATVFFLVLLNVSSMKRMRTMVVVLVLLSCVLAVQGIAAYHYGYMEDIYLLKEKVDTPLEAAPVFTQQDEAPDRSPFVLKRIRSLGFLNDPNDLAQALLVMFPFLGLAWRPTRWLRNLFLVLVPMALLFWAIYLTHSRGGMLGLLVLVLLALGTRLGRFSSLILTGAMAVLLLAANFSGGRAFALGDQSVSTRVASWSEGLQMLKSNPILGVGYGAFTDYHERTAHNSFVLCFSELGLVGYFFWLGLIATAIFQLRSLKRLEQEDQLDVDLRRWSTAILLALYTFLTAALFLSRTYIMTLYLLLAMGVALVDIARSEDKPVAESPVTAWATRVWALELSSIVVVYLMVRVRFM